MVWFFGEKNKTKPRGDNDRVEQRFRRTLEVDGDDMCALFNLALVCEGRSPNKAIELWKHFVEVAPSNNSYVKRARDNIARLKRIIS
jgi:cytochrome c-type biogenesis protein CcmH/NrfG